MRIFHPMKLERRRERSLEMDPILLSLVQAFLTVVAEKGFDSLGSKLKRLSKKLWKKLSSRSAMLSPYPEDCFPYQAQAIVQELENAASKDPSFKVLLDKWKQCAEPVFIQNQIAVSEKNFFKAKNSFVGISIGGTIHQSNDLRR